MEFEEDFPSLKNKRYTENNKLKTIAMIDTGKVNYLFRQREIEENCLDKAKVKKIIDKYIFTDLQGNPMPECKVLWKIKKELGLI